VRARQTGRQNGNQVKKACFSKLSEGSDKRRFFAVLHMGAIK
jgi:hypothetical protein